MKALVVIDMQNDFIQGALGTQEAQAIVPNVAKKIREFDGDIFCATLDTHNEDYLESQEGRMLPVRHCIDNTPGWETEDSVFNALDDRVGIWKIFEKPTFGSVELARYLFAKNMDEPLEEITLIGLCTDICVISNALLIKAFLPDVKITVDASCCAGVTPESHENALRAMQMCQIHIENWSEN